MKKKVIWEMVPCLLLLLVAASAHSQYYFYKNRLYETNLIWEMGASAAAMNALTDLGGKNAAGGKLLKDLDWRNTRPGWSAFGRVIYNQVGGLRVETFMGRVVATDRLPNNKEKAPLGYYRNIEVETNILECLLLAELYPMTILSGGRHPIYLVNPYLLAGIGFFHFEPMATYAGYRVSLPPLHTEGQGFPDYPGRKPYALNQCNIPLGLGFRYEISALVVCGLEVMYRKLFTDYLDDASTTYIDPASFHRNLSPIEAAKAILLADPPLKDLPPHRPGDKRGNPSGKDAYLSMNLKMAVTLGRERR